MGTWTTLESPQLRRTAHKHAFLNPMADPKPSGASPLKPLPNLIFASRWLQLPLYLGLIAAQAVYVFHFWVELVHLLEAAFGNQHALQILISSIGYKSEAPLTSLNETVIMLVDRKSVV